MATVPIGERREEVGDRGRARNKDRGKMVRVNRLNTQYFCLRLTRVAGQAISWLV